MDWILLSEGVYNGLKYINCFKQQKKYEGGRWMGPEALEVKDYYKKGLSYPSLIIFYYLFAPAWTLNVTMRHYWWSGSKTNK